MFRKLTALVFAIVLLSCLLIPVSGEISRVSDQAGLLNGEEITALEEAAASLVRKYEIHPVILTVASLEGKSAQSVADDYYDNAGYPDDGVLFLLALQERDWYISTSGRLIYALTDYGIQQIGESVVPYLAEENWYEGFLVYLTELSACLEAYENGTPVAGFADDSGDYNHGTREEVVYAPEDSGPNVLISLLCGVIAGSIAVLAMRYSMNTKRPQSAAGEYMKEGSWKVSQHRDLYLYSNVTKTRRQENKPSGGGSSVHRSSGGRSHGGGGGKF